MLKLPHFGHMTIPMILFDSHHKTLVMMSQTKTTTPQFFFFFKYTVMLRRPDFIKVMKIVHEICP